MSDILKKICSDKLEHIKKQKSRKPLSALREEIKKISAPRGFAAAISGKIVKKEFALIAEIKKASPSKGLIRADFNPSELAQEYENGGATCLSVLTDEKYFQGRDEYIAQVKKVAKLPVIRKDFMLDTYQVHESRALGADAILLIMAALSDELAAELEDTAIKLGMDVLIEVHDEDELSRALKLKSRLIGINNRDLKTFDVELSTTERLVKKIPSGYLVVCESGIYSHDDLRRMERSGVYSFLVGESLMRQKDVSAATRKLLSGKNKA